MSWPLQLLCGLLVSGNWLFCSVFFEWKKYVNFFIMVFEFFSNLLYC